MTAVRRAGAQIRWWVCVGCGTTWAWTIDYQPLRDAHGSVVCEQCHADPPEHLA